VQSALTYPIILFVLAMAALIFVPPYLFGGLFQLIESSGVEIPLITRILLLVSKFVSSPWFYILGAIIIAVALKLLPPILRRPEVRLTLTRYALKLPVIGKAIRVIAVTRFARSMEILVTVGVNIDQALEMSMEASNNPVLIESTGEVVRNLRNGATLAESLQEADFFPRSFLQMVAVGEESGKLPHLISKLADIYEVELEYSLEIAIQALEPIMLLFMGIVVGIVIIATMMPMMQVIQHL
jgi:type IV pilus assembly protein PilC